ncbi:hypothetical protein KAU39_06335 [bacterium]|nr:hypothetical protein [bacterium]
MFSGNLYGGKKKFFIGILIVYIITCGLLLNPDPPLTNDGPYYLLLSQSIVSHQGYRDIFHPAEMVDVEYPPIYPLLLAFILIILPKTVVGLKLLSLLFGIASLIIIYYFFADKYEDLPDLKLFAIKFRTYSLSFITYPLLLLLITFSNLWFLVFSITIAPEVVYLFFSFLSLIFLEKWIEKGKCFNRYLLFTVLSITVSFYIKALALSLIISGGGYLIIRKYYKKGFLFLAMTGFAVLPWIIRNRIINKTSLSQDYLGQFLTGHQLNFLDIGKTIFFNLTHYIHAIFTLLIPGYFLGKSGFQGEEAFSFLYSFLGKKEYFDPQSLSIFTIVISLLLIFIVGVGFSNQLKRRKLPEIYVLSYLFILLLFPKWFYISSSNRYLLPLLPFIIHYFLKGIFLLESLRLKIKQPGLINLRGNLVWTLCFILVVANLVPAVYMISGNITYLGNYKFLSIEERKDYHSRWLLDYFTPAAWIRENTALNSVVMHCFPPAFYLKSNRKCVFFLLTLQGPRVIKINLDKMKEIENRINKYEVDYLVVGHQAEREIIGYLKQYSKIFMFELLAVFKTEMKVVEIYKVVKTNAQIKTLDRQGINYYKKRNYKQAVSKFNEIIRMQPNCKTYFNLGQCYEKQYLPKDAGEIYAKAIQLEPAYKTAKTRLYIIEEKEKIEQNPAYFAGYENLGRFYLEKGDLNKAVKNLNYALHLGSYNSSTHYNLGIAYLKKKEYKSALEELKKSLSLQRNLVDKYRIKHYIKIAKMKLRR